ncbi:MAG TPA: sigma-70 family RNA polymerase sigma factor [Thermoanaerobaculia bacterium]|jgi:RNA polymerase sigma-70 factor (ECF subfamily)|nr:sigma-70 family RNA polymerase sigma factor [Thermoanaerobaculia bacterium]
MMDATSMFEGSATGSLALDRLVFSPKRAQTRSAINEDPIEARAIAAVKSGDASSYDYLVSKYIKRVISIAWGVVRNAADAEDLAQEAFVKAFENVGRFKTGEPFGPWIYRIVTNLALDVMKHRKRFRHEEITDAAPAARRDRADLPAIANELAQRIDRGIQSLPEMQRIVARLYLVDEFGHSEIAVMTGLSEGTVRSHLSLARGKLKEKLADLHGGSND